jgi:hypothetical protein
MLSNDSNALIMGLAANYSIRDVAIFLDSLEQTGFGGTLVLFVRGGLAADDLPKMGFRIQLVEIKVPNRLRELSWCGVRHYFYLDYLKSQGSSFENIFLVDVRDVFFQINPFEYQMDGELLVTLEDKSKIIGTCWQNATWILNKFGKREFEKLKMKRISCAGTTRGTKKGIMAYLKFMCKHLYPNVRTLHMEGYDQGVHNVIVHNRYVDGISIVDNSGPILTLNFTPDDAIVVDANGQLRNDSGQVAHVVHQYDRNPRLLALANERFGWREKV